MEFYFLIVQNAVLIRQRKKFYLPPLSITLVWFVGRTKEYLESHAQIVESLYILTIMQKAHVKNVGGKLTWTIYLASMGQIPVQKNISPNRHLAIVIGVKDQKKLLFI
jgi:hypothetical protein